MSVGTKPHPLTLRNGELGTADGFVRVTAVQMSVPRPHPLTPVAGELGTAEGIVRVTEPSMLPQDHFAGIRPHFPQGLNLTFPLLRLESGPCGACN
jgi:hypothetical protein